MKDYYNILGIERTASKDTIYSSYYYKISQFNNLPFLTKQMINEIKELKEALYVLGNKTKKEKYDSKLFKKESYYSETINNTEVFDRMFSIKFN
jgi:DnaJ-class molecular chaperone